MLYPSLQININKVSKKRGLSGLDEPKLDTPSINTPNILELAVQMEDEKPGFAFNTNFKQERIDDKYRSLDTPIIEFNQSPFFNQSMISPTESLNNFVPPNDILNTYTTVNSNTTPTTTNVNLPSNSIFNQEPTLNHLTATTSTNNLFCNSVLTKQETTLSHDYHQPTYTTTSASTYNPTQINQYTNNLNTNLLNLNNQNSLTNNHLSNLSTTCTEDLLNQHSALHHDQHLIYTELKSRSQQQDHLPLNTNLNRNKQQGPLIPKSVCDISGSYNSTKKSYIPASSPTPSSSSHTSSSNLDNKHDLRDFDYFNDSSLQESCYSQMNNYQQESSSYNRINRRYSINNQSSSMEKKSRLTKKQKFDAMVNEEKRLLKDNDQLKKDIADLEQKIERYKQSIMNVVKDHQRRKNN